MQQYSGTRERLGRPGGPGSSAGPGGPADDEWRGRGERNDRPPDGGTGADDASVRVREVAARCARFAVRTLRAEWHGIVVDPVRRLARRGLSGLVLAFVAAFGVIFFHAVAQRPAGEAVVRVLGGVQADLPLWLALLRTPVSLYVPALDLPVWAGITQLFLAFALAELTLGRGRTLFVSYATTLAGTLTVRVMIAVGPGWWGLGLPPGAGRILDTGPSAAVVGLFTYLSVVRRAPVVFFLTGGSMVLESVVKPNLAGREHLIAVATAIVLALFHGRAPRWLPGPAAVLARWRRTPAPAGAPTGPHPLHRPPRPRHRPPVREAARPCPTQTPGIPPKITVDSAGEG
ncbi:hypothetical protein [Streptomyces cyslabdanicus]|uniref:hypothetical protein n=1 Tax=Streptomyces cyslabdanicus TaxID=1470456 RepID=UPI004045090A